MKPLKYIPAVLYILLAVLIFAVPATARDHENEITIIDEDGVTYICKYDDDNMRVFNKETGEEILEMDFQEIEDAINSAMNEVEDALETVFEELSDIELDLHFGDDEHRLQLNMGDEDITIDFGEIFASLGEAFAEFEDLDCFHDGAIHINSDAFDHHDHYRGDNDVSELRKEIKDLKRELRKLKRELEKSDIEY
jgi:hypothetical protein